MSNLQQNELQQTDAEQAALQLKKLRADLETQDAKTKADIAALEARAQLDRDTLAFNIREAERKAAVEAQTLADAKVEKLEEQRRTTRKERWDRFLASIPLMVALIAPTIGFVQFAKTQEATQRAASHSEELTAQAKREATLQEARKTYNARKLDTYDSLIRVTGTLFVADKSSTEFAKARKDFETLLWTRLPLVADDNVTKASAAFQTTIELYAASNNQKTINKLKAILRNNAFDIAMYVRMSLKSVYEPNLMIDTLPNQGSASRKPAQ